MSQDEWDRRQAAGDWTQPPPYTPPTKTRPTHPWVDQALNATTNGNGDGRHVTLTPAASITPKRVRWTWDQRIAAGTLALLAGREGLGKSTIGYWMAARTTQGDLPGEHYGTPKASLVCATEDSWAHTIVPRLMAHGADLTRVFRIEVRYDDDTIDIGLSLPKDIADLEHAADDVDAALLILDPLMSRLDAELDSYKDGQVRRALEPLVSMTEQTGMATLGLIHHNKSGSTDPLQLVMASKAFAAVARSVHTVVPDPDDETQQRRFFGVSKNNLGRMDLPTLPFHIQGWEYDTDDGPGYTGQIVWGEESTETIADLIRRGSVTPEEKSQLDEAAEWLEDYLRVSNGREIAGKVLAAGKVAGHAERTLQRARKTLKIQTSKTGFDGTWEWVLAKVPTEVPEGPLPQNLGALAPLASTSTPTRQNQPRRQGAVSTRTRGAFEDTKDNEQGDPTCPPPSSLEYSQPSKTQQHSTMSSPPTTSGPSSTSPPPNATSSAKPSPKPTGSASSKAPNASSDPSAPKPKDAASKSGEPPTSPNYSPASRTCHCGQEATDLSGLCPACLANPGTLPPRNPELDF
jgi:AAA domain